MAHIHLKFNNPNSSSKWGAFHLMLHFSFGVEVVADQRGKFVAGASNFSFNVIASEAKQSPSSWGRLLRHPSGSSQRHILLREAVRKII